MKKVSIEITSLTLFVGVIFLVCCKAPALPSPQAANFPIYSGMWKDIKIQLPSDAMLRRCRNCEVMLTDTSWQLRPLSVGRCSIEFSTKNKDALFSYYWDVIQVPDPRVNVGPRKNNYDPLDRENLFLNLNLAHLGDEIYTMPGEFHLYKHSPSYEVFSFVIKIYNEMNTLLYTGENFSKNFSCDNADALLKHKKKGNYIVIENIIVFFPDKTHKEISMDTIFFK